MTKYIEQRQTPTGKVFWAFNPSKKLRNTLKVSYRQFDTRAEATHYSNEIQLQMTEHLRRERGELRINQDTVEGLISFYKTTTEWKKLSMNSQRFYDLMFKTARGISLNGSSKIFTDLLSKNVSPKQADELYQAVEKAKSPHRAVNVIKIMRKVWFVGQRHGRVTFNPFSKMGLKGLEDRKVLWDPEQVNKLIATADEMNLHSIGTLIMMCYHLCQRPGDMRMMRWEDYEDGIFEFVQEKTRTLVSVPASPELQERLAKVLGDRDPDEIHNQQIIICERTNRPYDRHLYVKYFARIRKAAGLPKELQIRDLRRTGATEMAEAGCTEDELRSVTGHQSRDVLSIYVRPTKKLAASGVNKRFGNHVR